MIASKIVVQGDPLLLKAYCVALKPESKDSERASYSVKIARRILKNAELVIDIEGKDVTAFRAVTTSILGILAVTHQTFQVKTKA